MLYRFNSAISGEIVMLTPHAEEIFAAIGRPLGRRGVITPDQMPAAIAALEEAIALSRTRIADPQTTEEEEEEGSALVETPVPFRVRAQPFLKMLRQNLAARENVTWGI